MSKVRRRFRLVLDGEVLEVQTNAMDLVKAERDGQGPIQQGMRTAHMACLRLRKPVPVKFEAFAEQLDEWDDLTDDEDDEAAEEEGGGDLDPTRSEGSEPSP
jgi:hypothetical protein